MISNDGDDDLGLSSADAPPFLSSSSRADFEDAADDDDIEILASKACALASVPVPDYAEAIARANAASKRKYGNRFIIDDDDDDDDDDDNAVPLGRKFEEDAASGIALAERTASILSNFQDYVSGIGQESPGNAGENVPSDNDNVGGDEETATSSADNDRSLAGAIRDDNKSRILERRLPGERRTQTRAARRLEKLRRRSEAEGWGDSVVGGRGHRGSAMRSEDDHGGTGNAATFADGDDGNLCSLAAAIEEEEGEGEGDFPNDRRKPDLSYYASDKFFDDWELNGASHEGGRDAEDDPEANARMVRRGQKYTHPLLESRKVKLGLINCVLVAVIVFGVSLGLSNRERKAGQELGDQIEKLEEELAKDKEEGIGQAGDGEDWRLKDGSPPPSTGESDAEKMVEMVAEEGGALSPEDTAEKDLPHVTGGLPVADEGDPDVQAESDAEKIVESFAESGDDSQVSLQDMAIYRAAVAKYLPREFNRQEGWHGETHLEAREFCEGQSLEICPYDAICPLGPGGRPTGGYEERRIPVGDYLDDWVWLRRDDACMRRPERLANSTEPDEDEVARVTCCSPTTKNETLDAESALYQAAKLTYLPLEFNRSDGWNGRTYVEALRFCGRIAGYEVCPYDALCPLGADNEPLGGPKDGTEGAWVPILDAPNDWAQIGEEEPCSRHSFPSGSLLTSTGGWDEEMTRHLICCVLIEEQQPTQQSGQDVMISDEEEGDEDGGGKEEGQDAVPQLVPEVDVGEAGGIVEATVKTYKVTLHDRTTGWDGQTYGEAAYFCANEGQNRSICPFEAICPSGVGTEPLGGSYLDETWMPIFDGFDDWVQVAGSNPCFKFSQMNAGLPKWGIIGNASEEVTRYIMCCSNPDEHSTKNKHDIAMSVKEIAEEAQEGGEGYQVVMEHYQPMRFDREDGWEGVTYLDAVSFCANNEEQEICPYHVICPSGPDSTPIIGSLAPIGNGRPIWVPISDDSNDWVNLSSHNTCTRYSSVSHNRPDWGVTGVGGNDFTPTVICCKESTESSAEESFPYLVAAHHPVWYNRDNGWTGQTYEEGVHFCEYKSMSMCPYEAYCPMAMDTPMEESKDDGGPGGSWAPIINSFNTWVSIGSDNTCQLYHNVYGEQPEWGTSGIRNEDMTHHIMCCTSAEDEVVSDVNSQESVTFPFVSDPFPTPPPTPLAPSELTPTNAPPPSNRPMSPSIASATDTAVEANVDAKECNPVWYGRSSGWVGQTYDEAFSFCSKQGPNHNICPYEAICPGGPLSVPYGGSKGGPKGSWAPINEPFNSWVQLGKRQSCVRYMNSNAEDHPKWGLTGIDDEVLTRHVACCDMTNVKKNAGYDDAKILDTFEFVVEKYAPKWFNHDEGWNGKTYVDAITFCASKDSSIPCPYEAYCPDGEGSVPTGGYDGTEEAWAAIMDIPNGWVQIGKYQENSISTSCMEYNSLHKTPPLWGLFGDETTDMTPHIMCCKEPANGVINEIGPFANGITPISSVSSAKTQYEKKVLEDMHPVWFGRRHGYHGTTWGEASDFCKAIGDMVLCPRTAYCPDEEKQLFLQRDPFEGEQWAPAASEFDTEEIEYWVSIGKNRDTCSTHEESLLSSPEWALVGNRQELKQNILCCQNPQYLAKQLSLAKQLDPIWLDKSHGWDGGSHDDAVQFCEDFGMRKLCPYTAYCPHGPGQPAMGRHTIDFNTEGEQWAPFLGGINRWVMIGQKYQNHATTCTGSQDLEGAMPDWGMSTENAKLKKYILCCSL